MNELNISILLGTIIKKIDRSEDELIFHLQDGRRFKMFHRQDCCESVIIEDICGELDWLIDNPILRAEERSNSENALDPDDAYVSHFTWTFYELATLQGAVTIRWCGTSNGYYSESVDLVEINSDGLSI